MHWWSANLAEEEAAHRVLSDVRPDVIFHLAGHVTGDRTLAAVQPTVRDNLRHASLSTTSMYLHSDDLRRAKQIGGAFEAPSA